MAVNYQPKSFHTVTPYLIVQEPEKLIEFLKRVFDATEVERMTTPQGNVVHAEVKIGDSMVMMGGAREPWRPMPAMLYVYVPDTDATYQRALAAGATSAQEPGDQFYGDRTAGVKDAAGNLWWIATHKEDIPPDEMKRRSAAREAARAAES